MLAALGLTAPRMDSTQSKAAPAGQNIAAIAVSQTGVVLAVGPWR